MDTEHDKGHGGNAVGHVSPCGTQTVTGLEELATIECCDVELMGKPLTGTEKGMGVRDDRARVQSLLHYSLLDFLKRDYVRIYKKKS